MTLYVDGDYITSPVGLLASHDLWTPATKDAKGNIFKTPRYSAWVGFRKDDPDWPQFLKHMQDIAVRDWPSGQYNVAGFAWKMVDGDGMKSDGTPQPDHCRGHWMVSFSSTFAPEVFNVQNNPITAQHNAVKAGDYVQVNGSMRGNSSDQSPGIYVNLSRLRVVGFGQAIASGPSAETAFGAAPATLPPGASATPVAPVGAMPAAMPGVSAIPPVGDGVPVVALPVPTAQALLPVQPVATALPSNLPGVAVASVPPQVQPAPPVVPGGLPGTIPAPVVATVSPSSPPGIAPGVQPHPGILTPGIPQ